MKENSFYFLLYRFYWYIFNMIQLSSRRKLLQQYTWINGHHLFSPPLPASCCVQEAIPQEQEIWNYNSVRDKWYVARFWIINESRRALVMPSRPSMIQTVWHKQDMVTTQTHMHTIQHMQTCQPHQIQPCRSCCLLLQLYFYFNYPALS